MSPKDAPHPDARTAGAFSPARIAVTVLAVLAIVFICVNTEDVTIRVIVPKVTMPLWAALLGMFVVGLLCGGYALHRRRRR
ncbi:MULTISPECIES: LapA family protein [Streptomyces]|uniref:LapA family protein n=1 Tax=Streptomyces TaxID=1883 RepID=UPI000CD5273D|nr:MULTISPECIES: LapA family protein [unclassified Streptomyces]AWL41673.1 LapA family protein [Streptomyces sp. SM18]